MVKNKELQEQRMKGYFIQATKDILRGEGLSGISVRNIADQAGYSYATLYNYFRDVNDLVFLCVMDFQEECKQFVERQVATEEMGIERLKKSVLSYTLYFAEYPGIFELFYLAKGGDFGNKESIIEVISNSIDKVCQQDWDYCIHNSLIEKNRADILRSQLRFSVIGMLTLYLNRLTPKSYTDFITAAEKLISTVL